MPKLATAPWPPAGRRAGQSFSIRGALRRLASTEPELADQGGQLLGLLRQRMARRRRLLDHRRVLLGHLVHLVDGGVDLCQRGRLFLGPRGDLRDHR